MKMKRLVSIAMALLLISSLPVTAFAAEWNIAAGDITVNAGSGGQTVTQGTNVDIPDDAPVITGSSTTSTVTITAAENQTANVTLKDVNIDVSTTGGYDAATRSFKAGDAAVSTSGAGNVTIELEGENTVKSGLYRAGLEKNNTGSLIITDANNDNGSLSATGGERGAGIGGGGDGDGSDITITGGTVTATGGFGGAGIGGGSRGNGSNIRISNAKVTAKGGDGGAGIGGGLDGKGSDITVSGDAQLKVQGGYYLSGPFNGAAIGGGGRGRGWDIGPGADCTPDTSKLSPEGKIEYYAPGADMKTAEPTNITHGGEHEWDDGVETKAPTCSETGVKTYTCKLGDNVTKNEDISKLPHTVVTDEAVAPTYTHTGLTEGSHCSVCNETLVPQEIVPMLEKSAEAPLYRVLDKDEKDIAYKAERKDGVLTVTADEDFAVLTGTLYGVSTLRAQGVETIVFVTKSAKSTFALANLLEKGSRGETYKLTHDGKTVTFTLGVNKTDVSDILKKA